MPVGKSSISKSSISNLTLGYTGAGAISNPDSSAITIPASANLLGYWTMHNSTNLTLSGSDITSASDVNGGDNTLAAPGGVADPVVSTSGFSGTQSALCADASTVRYFQASLAEGYNFTVNGAGCTVFIVIEVTTLAAARNFVGNTYSSGFSAYYGTDGSVHYGVPSNGELVTTSASYLSVGTPVILGFRASSGTNKVNLWKNGSQTHQGTKAYTGSELATNFFFGGISGDVVPHKGYLGACMIDNAYLTDDEMGERFTFLNNIWSVY